MAQPHALSGTGFHSPLFLSPGQDERKGQADGEKEEKNVEHPLGNHPLLGQHRRELERHRRRAHVNEADLDCPS